MRSQQSFFYLASALWLAALLTSVIYAADPGFPIQATTLVSGQKPGSLLVYNIYYSKPGTAAPFEETEINLVNTHQTAGVTVRLFFVNGSTGAVKSEYFCLGPNQMAGLLASQVDPGGSGYVVAVAVDSASGCPVSHNFLTGDSYVKLPSYIPNRVNEIKLNAVAIAANFSGVLSSCNPNIGMTTLKFNGESYNLLPRILEVDNIPARADGNETTLFVNRISGNLLTGINGLGSLVGYVFDDAGNEANFAGTIYGPQFREPLSNTFPKLDIPIEVLLPAGRSGWMKFGAGSDVGVLGAAINFNSNSGAQANAFNWGQNLRQLTLTAKSNLIMPVAPLNCVNRPVLTSLSPDTVAVGSTSLTLTVRGTGFANSAVVRWNGSNRATTFVSTTQLNAVIPASDLNGSGAASITVTNASGGTPSNALAFAITQTCAYAVSASSQSFSPSGGSGAFNVNAGLGCDWTAASDAAWLAVLPGVRGKGSGTVTYTVAGNVGTPSRTARITIAGNTASISFTVTQSGLSAPVTELKIDDGSIDGRLGFGKDGGAAYFVNRITPSGYPATLSAVAIYFPTNVKSGDPFSMVVGSTPANSTNINGVALQRIPIKVNTLGQFNVYTIPSMTITSGDFVIGMWIAVNDYYPIAQDTTPPLQKRSYFSADGASFRLIDDIEGLAGNFMFRAQLTPTPASCPLPTTISPSIAAPEINVALNGTNLTGVTAVRFADNLPADFSVNNTSQLTTTVPSGALSGSLTVSKNGCPDTRSGFFNINQATATELSVDDGASEINIGFGNGGTGSYVNRLTPLSYPATLTGISIYFPGSSGLPAGAPVTALVGTNPSGGVNINNITFQQTSAQVQTQGQFNFIAVPPVTISSGDFVVGFRATYAAGVYPVADDTTPPSQRRSYTSGDGVTFRLIEDDNAALAGNFLIRARLAQDCRYTLSATGQDFTANGGAGNFNVTTANGCTWMATSNVNWVTIGSGSSGNGNGVVNFTVAANTSVSMRTGTITAGGQPFTVNQAGANSTPTITSLMPATVAAGSAGFTLLVNGSGFVNNSVVRWNGIDRQTSFVNSTQLSTQIVASDVANAGVVSIVVFTPPPGGGVSSPIILRVIGVVTSVSAASFTSSISAESIVAAYGSNLATGTVSASTLPLPTTLLGTAVAIQDSAGRMQDAPLFFVSPMQINYEMPPGVALGAATVTVTAGNGARSIGQTTVLLTGPGLFTADASGVGLAAASVLRVKVNGAQSYEPAVRFDSQQSKFVPVPIDLGEAGDQVFLLLFGTGIRRQTMAAARLGGVDLPVIFAGAQGNFVGLDQVNLGAIPRSLTGRGLVEVLLTIDGKPTNTVQVAIK